jgi:uncharacterized membrane protein
MPNPPAQTVPRQGIQAAARPPVEPQRYGEREPNVRAPGMNVGSVERWASLVGGGLLGVYGLTRGSLGGLALAALGGALAYRGWTGHCPAYSALGISTADRPEGPMASVPAGHGVKVEKTITISTKSPEELFRFWRNFENLPRFMRHLASVKVIDEKRSHWTVKGPFGMTVEWDAVVHNETPNEMIAWRSLDGADVETAGSVHFRPAPNGRGTEVRVILKYNPPAGTWGNTLAWLFGQSPAGEIAEDLRCFKQMMEAGEIATTRGQPRGTCA